MEKRDRIAALEEQLAEEEHIRERMAQLLAETAVALKGPEEARKRHGWQDLPEMVAALKIDLAAAQARIERYEALLNRCSDACKVVPVLVRNGEHISLPTHIEKAIGKDRHEG